MTALPQAAAQAAPRAAHQAALVASPLADLHPALDRAAAFSPEYRGGLSNHLPMALQALHALGADRPRLAAFFEAQAAHLEPRAAAVPAAHPADWPALRGRGRDDEAVYESLAAMFAVEIDRHGADAVLTAAVPRLVDGVAAGAFHGLLRSAHAVAARHEGELALGLAYWAWRWQPLAGASASTVAGTRPIAGWLDDLRTLPRPADGAGGFMITARMRAWAATPGFAAVAPTLRTDAGTLDALAAFAAGVYAASGDFTVLHMVTACQAMRTLRPWWGDEPRALRHFSVAAAAAWLASDAAGVSPAADAPPPPAWPAIVEAAIASDDEHVVKLVEACRRHEAAIGDVVFRRAAARAVGLPGEAGAAGA